jgi:hypothetical protein
MQWISRNDPPLYVWNGDTWYNQGDKKTYQANIPLRYWYDGIDVINFPKKTKVMS